MPAASRVWTWLAKPRNRSVLAFLGAGLAAIVAAAWQLYLHTTSPPAAAPPPTPVVIQMQAPPAQAAAQPAGPPPDVSAVRKLQASETRDLNDEANALDSIGRQIEASNPPPHPAAQGR